jgi:hypothetical protein
MISCAKIADTLIPGLNLSAPQYRVKVKKNAQKKLKKTDMKTDVSTKTTDIDHNPDINQKETSNNLDEHEDTDEQSFSLTNENDSQIQSTEPEKKIVNTANLDNQKKPLLATQNIDKKNQTVCNGESITKHWKNLNKVVVIADILNIREKYGSHQTVIGTAERCAQLKVIDKRVEKIQSNKGYKTRGWLKVTTESGLTGWVASWHTRYIEE